MRVGIIASGREDGLVESLIAAGVRSGFGDDWVRVIGVEWCPDCSTSGRTAAYHTPYVGTPIKGEPVPNTGMLLYELEDMKARATAAHRAGLLVMIEGVGDRGGSISRWTPSKRRSKRIRWSTTGCGSSIAATSPRRS